MQCALLIIVIFDGHSLWRANLQPTSGGSVWYPIPYAGCVRFQPWLFLFFGRCRPVSGWQTLALCCSSVVIIIVISHHHQITTTTSLHRSGKNPTPASRSRCCCLHFSISLHAVVDMWKRVQGAHPLTLPFNIPVYCSRNYVLLLTVDAETAGRWFHGPRVACRRHALLVEGACVRVCVVLGAWRFRFLVLLLWNLSSVTSLYFGRPWVWPHPISEDCMFLGTQRVLLALMTLILFLHDSRETPETAVSLLHQKRLGSGSEPTKEKIKLLK